MNLNTEMMKYPNQSFHIKIKSVFILSQISVSLLPSKNNAVARNCPSQHLSKIMWVFFYYFFVGVSRGRVAKASGLGLAGPFEP